MVQISRPTLRLVEKIKAGKIEDSPARLNKAGIKPQPNKVVH